MKKSLIYIIPFLLLACSNPEKEKTQLSIKKGNEFLNKKNYSSALISFQDVLKNELTEEEKSENYRNISICFSNLKDIDSAKKYSKLAYEIVPENSYLHQINKGEYYLLEKRNLEALAIFRECATKFPDKMEVHNNLSLIYSGAYGEAFINMEDALEEAKKAYNLNKNANNKEQLASVYFQLENFKKASELFSELSKEFPEIKMYQFNYGQCLYFSGEEDKGIELMEDAALKDSECDKLFQSLRES